MQEEFTLQPRPNADAYVEPILVVGFIDNEVYWVVANGNVIHGSLRYATRYWVTEDHECFWSPTMVEFYER